MVTGDLGEDRGAGVGEMDVPVTVPHQELERAAVHVRGDREIHGGRRSRTASHRPYGGTPAYLSDQNAILQSPGRPVA